MSNGGCDGRKKEKKSEARGGGAQCMIFSRFFRTLSNTLGESSGPAWPLHYL